MDECAACMMEILNINDASNVYGTLEALSQIQYDKLRHGVVKTDFLRLDQADTDSFFTEDQKAFLSIFKKSLLTKTELGLKAEPIDAEEVPKNSLFDANQQLLFAHYLLQCISARDSKNQLLYTLNAFRSIQKRITLELRELGSRDRVERRPPPRINRVAFSMKLRNERATRTPPLALAPRPWRGAVVKQRQLLRGTGAVERLGEVQRATPSNG